LRGITPHKLLDKLSIWLRFVTGIAIFTALLTSMAITYVCIVYLSTLDLIRDPVRYPNIHDDPAARLQTYLPDYIQDPALLLTTTLCVWIIKYLYHEMVVKPRSFTFRNSADDDMVGNTLSSSSSSSSTSSVTQSGSIGIFHHPSFGMSTPLSTSFDESLKFQTNPSSSSSSSSSAAIHLSLPSSSSSS
jgi:hypothetical protein